MVRADWCAPLPRRELDQMRFLIQLEHAPTLASHILSFSDTYVYALAIASDVTMNFAPYQDASPEIERALSPPPPNDPRMSKANGVRSPPPRPFSPSPGQSNETPPLTRPNAFAGESYASNTAARRGDRGVDLEAFQTSLPMRLDYEAMLAYLLLPPAGGVFLLLTEHKSDYVRFHAWQSSMLFAVIFIVHLIFAWSTVISWMLFAFDLILIAFLAMHAYRDGKNISSKGQV